jgi:hypothetical protein
MCEPVHYLNLTLNHLTLRRGDASYTHSLSQSSHARTHARTHANTHAHTHTHRHSLSLSLSHTHTHTRTCAHAHAHPSTHAHTHTRTRARARTHACTHSVKHWHLLSSCLFELRSLLFILVIIILINFSLLSLCQAWDSA